MFRDKPHPLTDLGVKTQILSPGSSYFSLSKMSSISKTSSISIVGGGIGGLVLALQLHFDGFTNIFIFDSSRQLKAVGSGINLQPSAILVLRNLGLLPALEATGIKTAELRYYNRYGH
jgi:hypothetical protein